jgi:hypothetical protein
VIEPEIARIFYRKAAVTQRQPSLQALSLFLLYTASKEIRPLGCIVDLTAVRTAHGCREVTHDIRTQ